MSFRPAHFVALCSLVAACGEPVSDVPEALAGACPVREPARLVAAPPGFVADLDTWYGLHVLGDHVLFTFDALDDPERVYWRLDRCTGDLAEFTSLAPGLHNPHAIPTEGGLVLYANDALGTDYIVDRLDVPGDDEARPVAGLPAQLGGWSSPNVSPYPFAVFPEPHRSDRGAFAAGIGGTTWTYYTHAGDAQAPALALGHTIVNLTPVDAAGRRFYLHDDDGQVHRIDPRTGDREPVLTGVRHLTRVGELDRLIWQELGDDIAETIYLRDLATGEDTPIAVNDFAQRSWYRDPDQLDLGRLHLNTPATVAVLPGPERTLVAAARTDTGAALEIPAHHTYLGGFDHRFNLLLADDPERVEALWDPLTGEVREWYRGPAIDATLRSFVGDLVEYYAPDPGNGEAGTIWRVDLATGAREQLVTRASRYLRELGGGRWFLDFIERRLPGPPLSGSSYISAFARDLKLLDAGDGRYTVIAEDVPAFSFLPDDDGLVYLDVHGDQPGVWVHPLAR